MSKSVEEIQRVMDENPDLSANGIQCLDPVEEFAKWRKNMLEPDYIAQFERAKEFLAARLPLGADAPNALAAKCR